MADYNIEMQKRNPENTGWDKIYPITKGTNVIASNGKTFEEHVSDEQNPHGTTKAQVGLGSVLNYGIATQAAAESGTSNTLYMTPLRTKQAIAVNKAYHVGASAPSNTNLLWIDTG